MLVQPPVASILDLKEVKNIEAPYGWKKTLQKHTDIVNNDNILFCETPIQSNRVIILSFFYVSVKLLYFFSDNFFRISVAYCS